MHQAHLITREEAEILLRGLDHEILPLDVQLPLKRKLAHSQFFVLQVIGYIQVLSFSLRIVVNHQLDGIQHGHHAGTFHLQILTDAVLQHRIVHRALALGHTAHLHKHLDGLRRKSSPSQRRDRHKAGIIPSVHNALLHQLLDVALASHHVGQVELGKLNLAGRRVKLTLSYHPVVEWSVILKFQRTDRVGDLLHCVLDRVSEIIHGVDAPLVPCIVVGHMGYSVDDGVAHVDVGRRHVDLGAQHFLPIFVLPVLHSLKQGQVLLHRAIPVRAVLSGLCEGSSVLPYLLRAQVTDIGLPLFDQLHRALVHDVKIIRGKVQMFPILCTQPLHICLDGLHKLHIFFHGVCVVEAQVEFSAVLLRQPVI